MGGCTPTRAAAAALTDGVGGASLAALPVGVAAGTRVATAAGPVAVEELRPGDFLPSGQRVVGLTRRTLNAEALARDADARPVHLAAGALADGVPDCALLLAPGQLVLIGGHAVPAAALVNGVSVTRVPAEAAVTFFAVQLDGPAGFLAAGVACDGPGRRPAAAAAIAAVRRELALRCGLRHGELSGNVADASLAGAAGWTMDPTHPSARVVVELVAGGAVVGHALADRRRSDLIMGGVGDGHCGFALHLHHKLPASRSHLLQLRRQGDGADLPGSPVLLPRPAGEPADFAAALAAETAAAASATEREDLAAFLARQLGRLLQERAERPRPTA